MYFRVVTGYELCSFINRVFVYVRIFINEKYLLKLINNRYQNTLLYSKYLKIIVMNFSTK